MSLLNRIFKPKVQDTSENRRLKVALHERPLREFFNEEHWQAVKRAREWNDNTPQIFRIDNPKHS